MIPLSRYLVLSLAVALVATPGAIAQGVCKGTTLTTCEQDWMQYTGTCGGGLPISVRNSCFASCTHPGCTCTTSIADNFAQGCAVYTHRLVESAPLKSRHFTPDYSRFYLFCLSGALVRPGAVTSFSARPVAILLEGATGIPVLLSPLLLLLLS